MMGLPTTEWLPMISKVHFRSAQRVPTYTPLEYTHFAKAREQSGYMSTSPQGAALGWV